MAIRQSTTDPMLDALRQQFAQVQMGHANLDVNGNDTGIRYLRQPDGSTLTLHRNATGGWNGLLGSPFDQPGEAGKYGGYLGTFDDSGRLTDAHWKQLQRSDGWFGENLGTIGPALVLAAAAAGGGLFGGNAPAAPAAAPGATPSAILAPSAQGTMPLIGELGTGTFGSGAAMGAAELPFGALTGSSLIPVTGQQAITAGMVGGGLGAAGAAAGAAQQAAPATQAAQVAQAPTWMDTAKTIAGYAKDAAPLLGLAAGAPSGQLDGMQAQLGAMRDALASLQPPDAPPVPGANAEARGYQPGTNAIVDVLNRNRQTSRNRTMLTGPGGVSMASTRVGGNTLLGM